MQRKDAPGWKPKSEYVHGHALGNQSPERTTVSPAVSGSSVAQCRMGFEIETGIPITRQETIADPSTASGLLTRYMDAHPQTMAQALRYGDLVISADHSVPHAETPTEPFRQWSIVEAVTDPIDDSMDIAPFTALARTWLERIIALKETARRAPPAQPLNPPYHVGLPSDQPYDDWDRIAPQMTAGVPLDQVGRLISSFPLSGTTSAYRATELAQAAPGNAMQVIQQLLVKRPSTNPEGVAELRGLITLMMNYLMAGNDPAIAKVVYMKNRPANVFYKSKLSDVSTNVRHYSYGHTILDNEAARVQLALLLLEQSGRAAAQPLFIADLSPHPQAVASQVTVGGWITEVLNGTDDRIFDEMKNPWTESIHPDANNEVVIELRKLGFNLTHANFRLEDFDNGLLQYMRKVYIANKALKNHEAETP